MENSNIPLIEELRLKNYKSFKGVSVKFSPLTFLVGKNGAGKSNILDSLEFLSDCMNMPLKVAIERRGGLDAIKRKTGQSEENSTFGVFVRLRLYIDGLQHLIDYGFELVPKMYGAEVVKEICEVVKYFEDGRGERITTFSRETNKNIIAEILGEDVLVPKVEVKALLLPLYSGIHEFSPVYEALSNLRVYSFNPDVIRNVQEPGAGKILEKDGSNLTSVLREIKIRRKSTFTALLEHLSYAVTGIIDIKVIRSGNKLTFSFMQKSGEGENNFRSFSMSDGTLRTLGILTALYQTPPPLAIGIEEPEATIHPGALGTIFDVLQYGKSRGQIIVTTHSPDILDNKDISPDEIRLVVWMDGESKVLSMSDDIKEIMKAQLMSPGKMLRCNVLDGMEANKREEEEFELFS